MKIRSFIVTTLCYILVVPACNREPEIRDYEWAFSDITSNLNGRQSRIITDESGVDLFVVNHSPEQGSPILYSYSNGNWESQSLIPGKISDLISFNNEIYFGYRQSGLVKVIGNGQFEAVVSGSVEKLALYNGYLYAGGDFLVDGSRFYIVAYDGNEITPILPKDNNSVHLILDMEVFRASLFIAGRFENKSSGLLEYSPTKVEYYDEFNMVYKLDSDDKYLYLADYNEIQNIPFSPSTIFRLSNQLEVLDAELFFGITDLSAYDNTIFVGGRNFQLESECLVFKNGNWEDIGISDMIEEFEVYQGRLYSVGGFDGIYELRF